MSQYNNSDIIIDWHGIPLHVEFDHYRDDDSIDIGVINTIDAKGNDVDEIDLCLNERGEREILQAVRDGIDKQNGETNATEPDDLRPVHLGNEGVYR